jgi:N-acetylglucosaminyldiphosphoundecaprenol N-acetyl-beta-D-mannosaminyltransferase
VSGRVALAGIGFDALTEEATIATVIGALEQRRGGWITTLNLDMLRLAIRSPETRELVSQADLVVADGQPLVWSSRLQGTPLPERVAGSNLIWSLTGAAAQAGRSIYLLGGDPGAAEAAAERLRARSPELRIAGLYCPPFGFERDPAERERIARQVREAAPDIVFVGLGFPKQDDLICDLRPQLPEAWFLGVGISISFAAGHVKRAPPWMHGLGIEWVHRLVQEPRRLASRYLVHDPPFAARLLAESLVARARRTRSHSPAPAGAPLPVSVVIPAYRRPEMVERAVRSVLRQSRPADEVIVVDDASGDETGARAEALGARLITHEQNLGEGAARNTGIEAARHDWVALLDCDDEWLPKHLATLWAERNGHALVGTAVLATRSGSNENRVFGWTGRRLREIAGPAEVTVPENMFPPSAVMLSRDATLAAGGFPELERAADLDLWVRLLENGTAVAIPEVTSIYHLHGGQVSADPGPMFEAHRSVLDAYADRPWCTRRLRLRHEGVIAWDTARSQNGSVVSTVALLARRLANPQRAIGAAQLLAARFRRRRRAARFATGGIPSVAVLPGCPIDPVTVPGAVDLRAGSTRAALLRLLRRPTARAYVHGAAGALLMRALGIEPIRLADRRRDAS